MLHHGLFTRFLPTALGGSLSRMSSLWVPDYFELAKTKYPEYEKLNVQIKGYDYVVLESFQSKIHWLAKEMGFEVPDAWAQEHQLLKVTRLKPQSSTPQAEYLMKLYERNVQLHRPFGIQLQIFLELICTACPAGVNINVIPHEDAIEESRYVPQYDILELREKLNSISKK